MVVRLDVPLLLLPLLLAGGCAEPRLPITWRPLDEAGTSACVIAREAVEGDRGFDAKVWTAIHDEAARSDRDPVRAWAETLDQDTRSARTIERPRRTMDGRDVPGERVVVSRPRRSAEEAITAFYGQCPYGFPEGPMED
jgi:hypothetical protein